MHTAVLGKDVRFPNKLEARKIEIEVFARELIVESPKCIGVRVWETKRGDLAAKLLYLRSCR